MNCLLDDMNYTGSNLTDYMEVAKAVDSCTFITNFKTEQMQMLNFYEYGPKYLQMRVADYETTADGNIVFGQKIKMNIENLNDSEKSIIKELKQKRESIISLYNEENGKTKYYFLGNTFYKTLAACQTGLGGKFLKTPGLIRDVALCEELQTNALKCHALIRREGRLMKVFALYRKKENRYPFAKLGEIALGYNVLEWNISQKKSSLIFEMSDFKKSKAITKQQKKSGIMLYPAILLKTSDTGYYSTTISAIWKYDKTDHFFIQETWEMDEETDVKKMLPSICDKQLMWFEKLTEKCLDETDTRDLVKSFGLVSTIGLKSVRILKDTIKNMNRKESIIFLLKDAEKLLSAYQKSRYETILQNFITV